MLGLGLFFGAIAPAAAAGFPIVTRYAVPEISAQGGGTSVYQTSDGVMQFGCRGLVSFDGERWTFTSLPNGFGTRGLDQGPDGKLWFAAIGDLGWFERGPEGWECHSLLAQIPADYLPMPTGWHAYASGRGAIFVADDKVLCWDGSKFTVWPMPGTRRLRAARAGDRVFVQHKLTGIYEMTPEGPSMFLPATIAGDAGIFLVERQGSGWTLVTSAGIFSWDGKNYRAIAGTGSDYIRAHTNLTAVVRLPDGRLALATTDNGVVFIGADGNLESDQSQLGNEERYITSLCVDRQNGLWAASASAVYRVALASPSRVFDARSEFNAQVAALGVARHGDGIAVLTGDILYGLATDGKNLVNLSVPGGPFLTVQASNPGVLVGGRRSLTRVVGSTATTVFQPLNDVVAITPERHRRQLFIAGRNVYAVTADNAVTLVFQGLPGFPSSLAEDKDGQIWVGTETVGLWRIRRGQLEQIGAGHGLTRLSGASRPAAMADNTLLVFNDDGGWFSVDGGERFERIDAFPAGYRAVLEPATDATNRLWTAVQAARAESHVVGRISVAGGRARWEPHSVEGLSRVGIPLSIHVDDLPARGQVLWIGGTAGLLRHEIQHGLAAPVPATPLLRAFAHDSAGARAPLVARLPYATRSIEFEFAAPDFARRPLLRLETRIDDIDRDWVPATPDSRRTLTALRDGDYTFRVRAVAETGVASEPAVVSFRVAPPWWRTAPAVLGVIFSLLPAGYGLYRLRLRTLHRRTLELEAKVRQRTEQLEQANAAKTQFVANMSHDIRNPLNGIVGLALALEDTRLDPRQREIVATLRECTTYLSSLVDDVLDFASIEAGRVELRPGPFVPRELLRSIVTTTKTDTAESGAQLVVDVDPALPAILAGDAGRIQQILVNYVSNALKYAGGTIHLTATIPLGSSDEVEFAVADGGPGITAAEQATLFTKFTRLAGARQHEIPGAGLGLAACRLLADIMGGSVGVVSQPGQGARFFLRLPLARAEIPEAPADGELPNTTVLLVEDTDYNALAATAVLRRLGLSCERARTGEEALQLFAAKRYNLVLLDRNLPDLDGTEIARRMRALETDGSQSILLAVTAYCTAEDRTLCLEAGMDAFVGKPLTPEKLRRVLLAAGRRMLATATFDAAPEPAPTDVNLSLLNYIADGDGGLDAQLDRFLASLAEQQAQLEAADLADLKTLETAAHRVLGQARIVGAAALTRVATELQLAAHAGETARCAELRPQVRAEVAALTAALRHRRSGALTS